MLFMKVVGMRIFRRWSEISPFFEGERDGGGGGRESWQNPTTVECCKEVLGICDLFSAVMFSCLRLGAPLVPQQPVGKATFAGA